MTHEERCAAWKWLQENLPAGPPWPLDYIAELQDNSTLSALEAENKRLREALEFYADPETYFAIMFIPDHPAGDFMDDFEELSGDLGHPNGKTWVKPGKCARAALETAVTGP